MTVDPKLSHAANGLEVHRAHATGSDPVPVAPVGLHIGAGKSVHVLIMDRNAAATGDEAEITTEASRVKVLVVPTNEEKTIARDVIRVLNGIMPEFTPPETFA